MDFLVGHSNYARNSSVEPRQMKTNPDLGQTQYDRGHAFDVFPFLFLLEQLCQAIDGLIGTIIILLVERLLV